MPNPDVIILGAGAAGLAAAAHLSRARRRVLILEARDRVGGRILTIRDPHAPLPLEMGAEFIHGRPDATFNLLRESGQIAYETSGGSYERTGSRLVSMEGFSDRMAPAMSGLSRLGPTDISFAEYLRRHRDKHLTPRSRAMALSFVQGFDAADPEQISALSVAQEQEGLAEVDSDPQHRLLNGYGPLIDHLRASCDPALVQIKSNVIATDLHWTHGRATVLARSGMRTLRFSAPRVIITLPIGVLHAPPHARGALRITPDLPSIRRALNLLASGPVVKALLLFRDPPWPRASGRPALHEIGFLHNFGAPFPTFWTQRPLTTPLITCWAGGPIAAALSGQSPRTITRIALDSLASTLGLRRATLAAQLLSAHVYDWLADPFSRGAYSYVRVGGLHARSTLAKPVGHTLYFAGEAIDTRGQASTVAGALASGRHAAGLIARSKPPRRRA